MFTDKLGIEMLDKAIKISAEIVHMGLLQVPVSMIVVHWGIISSAIGIEVE